MSRDKLSQRLLQASHVLFFLVVAGLLVFVVLAAKQSGVYPSIGPLALLFLFAFAIQFFTVCLNRQNLLAWILAVLYGIAATNFVFAASMR